MSLVAEHKDKAKGKDGARSWHMPPMITPNFGKRKKIGLKSNIGQVLLRDNVTQVQILQCQLHNLHIENRRSARMLELHKKSFLVQQSLKQQHLRASGVHHLSILPDDIANCHGGMPKYRNTDNRNIVTFDMSTDDNNNEFECSIKPSSASSSGTSVTTSLNVHEVPRPENIKATHQKTRSYSAKESNNFLTHDYHGRREKTAAAPEASHRRGNQQANKKKAFRCLNDPRYISLKKTLVPCGKSMDGYLQLSASGQYVMKTYSTPTVDQDHLQTMIREMTMIRQSRLNSRASEMQNNSNETEALSEKPKKKHVSLMVDHDHDDSDADDEGILNC